MGDSFSLSFLIVAALAILVLFYFVYREERLTKTYEKITVSVEEKTCPMCAGRIRAAALVCHFCGHDFYDARRSDNGPRRQDDQLEG